jgi:hypothetical protein
LMLIAALAAAWRQPEVVALNFGGEQS